MSSSIKGPFTRRSHTPGICRSCACPEFLALEPSKTTSYAGLEKCLSCPHKASRHVWNPIKPQVRCVRADYVCSKILTPFEQSVDSSPPRKFSVGGSRWTSDGASPSQHIHRADSTVLIESPERKLPNPLPPQRGPQPPPVPSPPAPPLLIPGEITLEKFYDYFLTRSDYSDALHRRLLTQHGQQNATLLNTVYLDFAALCDQTKTLAKTVHQLAESYWAEHPDKRPAGGHHVPLVTPANSAFIEASNHEEVPKSSWFPLSILYLLQMRNADFP